MTTKYLVKAGIGSNRQWSLHDEFRDAAEAYRRGQTLSAADKNAITPILEGTRTFEPGPDGSCTLVLTDGEIYGFRNS